MWPETAAERDWFPQGRQRARQPLPKYVPADKKKSWAEDARDAEGARDRASPQQPQRFASVGVKFPKAVHEDHDDLDELLTFFDFPAEHWIHLKTSRPRSSQASRPSGSHPKSPRVQAASADWRWLTTRS